MVAPAFDVPTQKAHLRAEMKARRALLNETERARAAWLLCDHLSVWLQSRPERSVAVFLSRPSEICLDALARELLRADYLVAAPRLEMGSGQMRFWQLDDVDATQSGPWGVREPVSDREVQPEIVLVPGLAFDHLGHRLGTGGGWYDRVLNENHVKIGVGFAAQILDCVPVEAHDVAMNFVASNAEFVRCETGSGALRSLGGVEANFHALPSP